MSASTGDIRMADSGDNIDTVEVLTITGGGPPVEIQAFSEGELPEPYDNIVDGFDNLNVPPPPQPQPIAQAFPALDIRDPVAQRGPSGPPPPPPKPLITSSDAVVDAVNKWILSLPEGSTFTVGGLCNEVGIHSSHANLIYQTLGKHNNIERLSDQKPYLLRKQNSRDKKLRRNVAAKSATVKSTTVRRTPAKSATSVVDNPPVSKNIKLWVDWLNRQKGHTFTRNAFRDLHGIPSGSIYGLPWEVYEDVAYTRKTGSRPVQYERNFVTIDVYEAMKHYANKNQRSKEKETPQIKKTGKVPIAYASASASTTEGLKGFARSASALPASTPITRKRKVGQYSNSIEATSSASSGGSVGTASSTGIINNANALVDTPTVTSTTATTNNSRIVTIGGVKLEAHHNGPISFMIPIIECEEDKVFTKCRIVMMIYAELRNNPDAIDMGLLEWALASDSPHESVLNVLNARNTALCGLYEHIRRGLFEMENVRLIMQTYTTHNIQEIIGLLDTTLQPDPLANVPRELADLVSLDRQREERRWRQQQSQQQQQQQRPTKRSRR